jgi:ATP-binding protein involved in chromosome partitioning
MAESHHSHSHAQQPGLAGVKNIIAIASGKGGVGKSTLSVNLAVALAQTGAKVGLMDADIYGPSQPGMLGARDARPDVTGDMLQPVKKFGINFVSMGLLIDNDGPVIWRAPMAMKIIHQFISNVDWGKLDYLLIDLPPGTGDVQLTLAQQASLTGAVIVTTPQQVALGVASKGLKMFEQVNVPIIGVIENMSGFVCKHCGKTTDIFKTGGGEALAKHSGVPYLGAIPLDPEIMMSGDSGKPVLENGTTSPAALAFLNVAKNLQGITAKVSATISADEPDQIELRKNGDLVVTWADARVSNYNAYSLRINCPCASCIDEDSGRRTLDPKRVPLDIRIESFEMIGRYAVALHFSDGHRTGLYAFKLLQQLPEADSSGSFEV